MRLIQTTVGSSYPYDVKIIQGLTLVQEAPDYRKKLDPTKVTTETKAKPTEKDVVVLLGLWELARRVESNAIVIGSGEVSPENGSLRKLWTLGVGSFRKRNGATKIALDNAGDRARGGVLRFRWVLPISGQRRDAGKLQCARHNSARWIHQRQESNRNVGQVFHPDVVHA